MNKIEQRELRGKRRPPEHGSDRLWISIESVDIHRECGYSQIDCGYPQRVWIFTVGVFS